jgi:hypothetical protein
MGSLVISCSEGRVTAALAALQEELGEREAERLIVPGGPLQLTRPGMERRVAMECIRSLVEAHDVRTVHLVSHQDCASYERALGGRGFDQRELLVRDLRRVKALLENAFVGLDVRCYLIPWLEQGEDAGFGAAEAVE